MYRNGKQKYFFDFSNCDKCIKTRNILGKLEINFLFYKCKDEKQQ